MIQSIRKFLILGFIVLYFEGCVVRQKKIVPEITLVRYINIDHGSDDDNEGIKDDSLSLTLSFMNLLQQLRILKESGDIKIRKREVLVK